ncbi:unnamed protein product [Amoebophrya sp. A120]|nr:unnamed protein product [Amoebophrya sp. A120]|eukprot:GSA120T00006895001.1
MTFTEVVHPPSSSRTSGAASPFETTSARDLQQPGAGAAQRPDPEIMLTTNNGASSPQQPRPPAQHHHQLSEAAAAASVDHAVANPPPPPPDRFQTIKSLGRGAFGQVDLIQNGRKKQYALKQYCFSDLQSEKHKDLALEEGSILQKIQHPNIVRCYWVQVTNYTIFLLLQYIDGGDLNLFLNERRNRNCKKPIPERKVASWFKQLLEALSHIHSLSILHRDIKPSNILLSHDQKQVYLADFGVCRMLKSTRGMANTNVGSPVYAAPEVWSNKSYSNKIDIFSLGCCIFEVCTTKPPFDGRNLVEICRQVYRGPPKIENVLNNVVNSVSSGTASNSSGTTSGGSSTNNNSNSSAPGTIGNNAIAYHYNSVLSMLISSMLQPNPAHRPSAKHVLERLPQVQSYFYGSNAGGGSSISGSGGMNGDQYHQINSYAQNCMITTSSLTTPRVQHIAASTGALMQHQHHNNGIMSYSVNNGQHQNHHQQTGSCNMQINLVNNQVLPRTPQRPTRRHSGTSLTPSGIIRPPSTNGLRGGTGAVEHQHGNNAAVLANNQHSASQQLGGQQLGAPLPAHLTAHRKLSSSNSMLERTSSTASNGQTQKNQRAEVEAGATKTSGHHDQGNKESKGDFEQFRKDVSMNAPWAAAAAGANITASKTSSPMITVAGGVDQVGDQSEIGAVVPPGTSTTSNSATTSANTVIPPPPFLLQPLGVVVNSCNADPTPGELQQHQQQQQQASDLNGCLVVSGIVVGTNPATSSTNPAPPQAQQVQNTQPQNHFPRTRSAASASQSPNRVVANKPGAAAGSLQQLGVGGPVQNVLVPQQHTSSNPHSHGNTLRQVYLRGQTGANPSHPRSARLQPPAGVGPSVGPDGVLAAAQQHPGGGAGGGETQQGQSDSNFHQNGSMTTAAQHHHHLHDVEHGAAGTATANPLHPSADDIAEWKQLFYYIEKEEEEKHQKQLEEQKLYQMYFQENNSEYGGSGSSNVDDDAKTVNSAGGTGTNTGSLDADISAHDVNLTAHSQILPAPHPPNSADRGKLSTAAPSKRKKRIPPSSPLDVEVDGSQEQVLLFNTQTPDLANALDDFLKSAVEVEMGSGENHQHLHEISGGGNSSQSGLSRDLENHLRSTSLKMIKNGGGLMSNNFEKSEDVMTCRSHRTFSGLTVNDGMEIEQENEFFDLESNHEGEQQGLHAATEAEGDILAKSDMTATFIGSSKTPNPGSAGRANDHRKRLKPRPSPIAINMEDCDGNFLQDQQAETIVTPNGQFVVDVHGGNNSKPTRTPLPDIIGANGAISGTGNNYSLGNVFSSSRGVHYNSQLQQQNSRMLSNPADTTIFTPKTVCDELPLLSQVHTPASSVATVAACAPACATTPGIVQVEQQQEIVAVLHCNNLINNSLEAAVSGWDKAQVTDTAAAPADSAPMVLPAVVHQQQQQLPITSAAGSSPIQTDAIHIPNGTPPPIGSCGGGGAICTGPPGGPSTTNGAANSVLSVASPPVLANRIIPVTPIGVQQMQLPGEINSHEGNNPSTGSSSADGAKNYARKQQIMLPSPLTPWASASVANAAAAAVNSVGNRDHATVGNISSPGDMNSALFLNQIGSSAAAEHQQEEHTTTTAPYVDLNNRPHNNFQPPDLQLLRPNSRGTTTPTPLKNILGTTLVRPQTSGSPSPTIPRHKMSSSFSFLRFMSGASSSSTQLGEESGSSSCDEKNTDLSCKGHCQQDFPEMNAQTVSSPESPPDFMVENGNKQAACERADNSSCEEEVESAEGSSSEQQQPPMPTLNRSSNRIAGMFSSFLNRCSSSLRASSNTKLNLNKSFSNASNGVAVGQPPGGNTKTDSEINQGDRGKDATTYSQAEDHSQPAGAEPVCSGILLPEIEHGSGVNVVDCKTSGTTTSAVVQNERQAHVHLQGDLPGGIRATLPLLTSDLVQDRAQELVATVDGESCVDAAANHRDEPGVVDKMPAIFNKQNLFSSQKFTKTAPAARNDSFLATAAASLLKDESAATSSAATGGGIHEHSADREQEERRPAPVVASTIAFTTSAAPSSKNSMTGAIPSARQKAASGENFHQSNHSFAISTRPSGSATRTARNPNRAAVNFPKFQQNLAGTNEIYNNGTTNGGTSTGPNSGGGGNPRSVNCSGNHIKEANGWSSRENGMSNNSTSSTAKQAGQMLTARGERDKDNGLSRDKAAAAKSHNSQHNYSSARTTTNHKQIMKIANQKLTFNADSVGTAASAASNNNNHKSSQHQHHRTTCRKTGEQIVASSHQHRVIKPQPPNFPRQHGVNPRARIRSHNATLGALAGGVEQERQLGHQNSNTNSSNANSLSQEIANVVGGGGTGGASGNGPAFIVPPASRDFGAKVVNIGESVEWQTAVWMAQKEIDGEKMPEDSLRYSSSEAATSSNCTPVVRGT